MDERPVPGVVPAAIPPQIDDELIDRVRLDEVEEAPGEVGDRLVPAVLDVLFGKKTVRDSGRY
ncbi:MAG: hypothetical protein R3E12_05330 [Candidatus Eisenbacteria bacterium]